MSIHVIEWGNQEDVDYITIGPTRETYEEVVVSTHALVCENCGAPMTRGTYKCEYCGTEYVASIRFHDEPEDKEAHVTELKMEVKTKRLEKAMQEQTARLYELMGMNAELRNIRKELKKL